MLEVVAESNPNQTLADLPGQHVRLRQPNPGVGWRDGGFRGAVDEGVGEGVGGIVEALKVQDGVAGEGVDRVACSAGL